VGTVNQRLEHLQVVLVPKGWTETAGARTNESSKAAQAEAGRPKPSRHASSVPQQDTCAAAR